MERPDEKYIPTLDILRDLWMNRNKTNGGNYTSFVERHEFEVGWEFFRDSIRMREAPIASFRLDAHQCGLLMAARVYHANYLRHVAEPWMSQAGRDAEKRDGCIAELHASGVVAEQINRVVFEGHPTFGPGNTLLEEGESNG